MKNFAVFLHEKPTRDEVRSLFFRLNAEEVEPDRFFIKLNDGSTVWVDFTHGAEMWPDLSGQERSEIISRLHGIPQSAFWLEPSSSSQSLCLSYFIIAKIIEKWRGIFEEDGSSLIDE